MGTTQQEFAYSKETGPNSDHLALALIVDVRYDSVVFWKVVPDTEVEAVLDEVSEKLQSDRIRNDRSDLQDILWVEDEFYDIFWVPLREGETAANVFRLYGWKSSETNLRQD